MKLNDSLRALCLITAVLLSSCATKKPLEQRTLPYRVAIVPMDEPLVGSVSPGELPGEATDMSVSLDCEELTEQLGEALEQYCFARVGILNLDDLGEQQDAFARRRQLLERAREQEVDLVIEFGLRYDSEIYRKNAGTFWLNYPLFLFAGPSNWFVGDNVYYADVDLTTTIYDMNVIEAGGFDLGSPAARVITASSRYNGADLDFVDRSDGAGDYALGIIIPSGFLSRESESTEEGVRDLIVDALRRQVVQGIQSRRNELVQAEWIAPVFIDPAEVRITRQGDELLVEGNVRVRRDSLVERVQALKFQAGGKAVTLCPVVSEEVSTQLFHVVPFSGRVPASTDASELRVHCEAGSRDRYVRSYTFVLP